MPLVTDESKVKQFPKRRDGTYYHNGKKYASVTSILGVIAKPQLMYWAAKLAAGKVHEDPFLYDTAEKAAAAIYTTRDKAAERGSTVHSLIEAFARRATVETIPEAYKGYADAFWAWVAATQPTPLYSEANVYSDKHGYAGTLDLICAYPDKKIRLNDVKTGKDIYPEVGLQMAAYRECDFILPHVNGDQPIPMPVVAETTVVLLMENGTFKYETIAGDFEAFLAAKRLWEWSQRSKGGS